MKNKILSILVVLFLTLFILSAICFNVKAAELEIKGRKEIEGNKGTLIVNVSNELPVGVVQGVLSYDDNFEYVKLNTSYNGWTTTYNENIGLFNIFNASGTKDGDVLELEYKLKDDKDKGTIKIDEIELTTIEYDILKLETQKTITITKKSVIEEPEDDSLNENTENSSSNNETEINDKDNNDKDEDENKNENNDNKKEEIDSSVADKPIPQTGKKHIKIILLIICIISIFLYKKAREYKV